MNIIDRARLFAQLLQRLAQRSSWDWHRCPHCGSTDTIKHGSYYRHPWTFAGRRDVQVQRHRCRRCHRTYSETSPSLVRYSWYGRDVHRMAVDLWVHGRSSLRRSAEFWRSWIGKQERWLLWCPWAADQEAARCRLNASTVCRWLDRAGEKAQQSLPEQWSGVASSGQYGVDGLWARLRQQSKRVVLTLVDTVTGVVWTTLVTAGEESAASWAQLFERARAAGLSWELLSGVVSDGAVGLLSFLREQVEGVHHQRCVWHAWRSLAAEIRAAPRELAQESQAQLREELKRLLHAIFDAASYAAAEEALAQLQAHPCGTGLAQWVNEQLDRLLYPLLPDHAGLSRIAPEWLWRDFRLRLSRGRNHGSEQRLERAALLWMVYHNLTPAQWRSERKRKYKHPGESPLQVAGQVLGQISYLDALEV
jgi:transposase-like protein